MMRKYALRQQEEETFEIQKAVIPNSRIISQYSIQVERIKFTSTKSFKRMLSMSPGQSL